MKDNPYSKYDGMGLKDLAIAYKQLQEEHGIAKAKAAEIWNEFDYVRFQIPKVMDDLGITTAKIPGVGRIEERFMSSAKQLDPNALAQWLVEHGHEDLIKETINASSLNSFIKHQIAEGDEIPPDDVVEFKPYTIGVVVKA